jgi:hypothetical protein
VSKSIPKAVARIRDLGENIKKIKQFIRLWRFLNGQAGYSNSTADAILG